MHTDKECLFRNIDLSIGKGEKVSVTGINGSGKSTLLRIISGLLPPSSGSIITSGAEICYVPQHFGQYDDFTIARSLGIEEKAEALHAILRGETDEHYFDTLGDDWDIEERAASALDSWGLGSFPLSHPMKELSGGEKTKVFLAGMELRPEAIILLDEPTNHLDYEYRRKLYRMVETSKSTMLVVSHDRTLLNLLPMTCELHPGGITVYGGNYDFYKEQKAIAANALRQRLEEKEKELRLSRKIARESAERQQKHDSRGAKQNAAKGVPRIAMGNLKSKAEQSTAKLNSIHANKIGNIHTEIQNIRSSIPQSTVLKTDFNSPALHAGKLLVAASGINFGYGNGRLLWKNLPDFQIRSGERISVGGSNGSGKTTLLKLITGELEPTQGTITRAENLSYVYMDQEYSMINDRLTILEQAQGYNNIPLPDHELKTILNRFLFPRETWNKPCSKLSGGEKMRLAFCCLMISNNTPDLFILDEPTNNLDIQSIEIITDTLRRYSGTIVLVSHDKWFVSEVGIDRELGEII